MNAILHKHLVAAIAAMAALTLGVVTSASAAVPGTMLIEGILTSTGGGAAADGSYSVVFSIYNVQSGGTAAWTEGAAQVAVKNGQFSHVLGTKTPLTADILGKLTAGWLGMTVATDPELPRQSLHAVAYALLADTATNLSCSGCLSATQIGAGAVSADKVGFTYAGAKTKGGPANSAIDLTCTGCVTVDEMKFDKDVDLGGNALVAGKVTAKDVAATTVQATSFVGDGSKLTGIKIPSGECKTAGEVVKGINPDGTLKCAVAMDPKALPADGIDEISNYLLHNQFVDKTCGTANVKIPDNNPTGVADELTFPDIGLAQKLDIELSVTNSNLEQVTIKVYDPNNAEYTLIANNTKGTSLTTSFPSKTATVKGDLTTWVNKNPKGKWRILAVDGAFLNNTFDGAIVSWCVSIQTLSNQKIQVKGNLLVGEASAKRDLHVSGNVVVDGNVTVKGLGWYSAFPAGSRPFAYGFYKDGTQNNWVYYERQQIWGAADVALDNDSLHNVADSIIYADKYGNINQSHPIQAYNDSTDDSQAVLITWVKNTTNADITKTVWIRFSSRDGNRRASLAINKSEVYSYGSNNITTASVNLKFPANKTSIVVLKCGAYYWTGGYYQYPHRMVCGYYNNSWSLPTGLEWDYQGFNDWVANN